MSTLEDRLRLVEEIDGAIRVLRAACEQSDEGIRRTIRAQYHATHDNLLSSAQKYCVDDAGQMYQDEFDKIGGALGRLQAAVRQMPDNPASIAKQLPALRDEIVSAIHEMPLNDERPIPLGSVTLSAVGQVQNPPSDAIGPQGQARWIDKPTNIQLITDVAEKLQVILKQVKGDNQLDPLERSMVTAVLQTSLKLLEDDSALIEKTLFEWLRDHLRRRAGDLIADKAESALGYAFEKAAELIEDLITS